MAMIRSMSELPRLRIAKIGVPVGVAIGALMAFSVAHAWFNSTPVVQDNSFTAAAVDHLGVSPSSTTVSAGSSQTYTAEAVSAGGTSFGDVTSRATVSISPDGSCTGATCTAATSGPHTVTATYWGVDGTASLAGC
jgi:hypothetical protein